MMCSVTESAQTTKNYQIIWTDTVPIHNIFSQCDCNHKQV